MKLIKRLDLTEMNMLTALKLGWISRIEYLAYRTKRLSKTLNRKRIRK